MDAHDTEHARERRNHRANTTTHDHDDPRPKRRRDGRLSWCCPAALEAAREIGRFDSDGEYVGPLRD